MREALRAGASFVWARKRLRIAVLCVAIAPVLLFAGRFALRASPFTSVEHVRVSGVHGPQASAIEAALVSSAHGMSTLGVNDGALLAAVAHFHLVSAIRAVASFPHSLRIEVSEQPAVAALIVDGQRTAVAADGVVLGTTLLSASLPTVSAYSAPAPGRHITRPNILAALSVLGAAPPRLATLIKRAYTSAEGLTLAMSNGLLVYFGDGSLPHAKWLSFERVLTDPGSAGASYIDVRLPARPAAGFPAGVTPPDSSGEGTTPDGSTTLEAGGDEASAVGALAAGLSAGTSTSTATPSTTSEPSSTSSAEASSEPEEAAAAGSGEASSTGEQASAP